MADTTIRISEQTLAMLKALANDTGDTIQEVAARAVADYFHHRRSTSPRLRREAIHWQDAVDERSSWDAATAEDIDEE